MPKRILTGTVSGGTSKGSRPPNSDHIGTNPQGRKQKPAYTVTRMEKNHSQEHDDTVKMPETGLVDVRHATSDLNHLSSLRGSKRLKKSSIDSTNASNSSSHQLLILDNKQQKLDTINLELTDFERRLIEKTRRITYSSDEEQNLLSVVDRTVNTIARNRIERPTIAPELWLDRDKSLKEEPHEFIGRIYAEYVEAGVLLRADIRSLDDPLDSALRRQENNPKRTPPESFYLPKQQDSLADDPSEVVKGGIHEGRQASGGKRSK